MKAYVYIMLLYGFGAGQPPAHVAEYPTAETCWAAVAKETKKQPGYAKAECYESEK